MYSPSRANPELRRRFADDTEHLLVHLSNFRPVKKVLDVVRIFARVSRKLPARLLLIGTGPERTAAEEEAESLGVKHRVCFLGAVDGVADLLACSSLLLLPSDAESFGLAALEAMSCAVPVVATRAGGVPEVVEHGVTGMLGEVGDVEGMAAMALSILSDQGRHEEMRAAARRLAEERFPLGAVVDEYQTYYEEIMARDPEAG